MVLRLLRFCLGLRLLLGGSFFRDRLRFGLRLLLGGSLFRNRLRFGLRLIGGLALLLELADPRVENPDDVAHRRGEEPDDRGQRAGQRTHELCAQRVGRRQLGEPLDVVCRDLGTVQEAALDHEHLGLGRVVECLCDRDRVTVGLEERDRGRALQHRQQRVDARGLGGTLRERVLDDREAGPVLDQLRAELVELGDGQAAVVRDDHRLARLQPLGELCDQALLFRSVHSKPPPKRIRPASRRACEKACSLSLGPPRLDFCP